MESTPDTLVYMLAGHIVFVIVFFSYIASMYFRWKTLNEEQELLSQMDKGH